MGEAQRKWNAANPECGRAASRKWAKANPHKRAQYKRKQKYGFTNDQYNDMNLAQNGRCAVCGLPRPLAVDHDHSTGVVRGLLCRPCNLALGHMDDDPQRTIAATTYLQKEAT